MSAVRFLTVGLGNTLVGLTVIYAVKVMGVSDIAANAIGYTIGVAISFTLNKRWTFRHDGPAFRAFIRFIAVLVVAYSANLVVVLGAISWLDIDSYISQALGVPVFTALSYIGSRWYAFHDGRRVMQPLS